MLKFEKMTVGLAIVKFLQACEVKAVFGVISIHNMPILDAINLDNSDKKIRFVMARGEAGAVNMADSFARTSGKLGVVISSTGTGAGNTAGSMVEALTAGTPLLHITGQIESQYLDQDLAYIHEAPDQLTMLKSISKSAFRVRNKETALATLKQAVQIALTSPTGPVSIEIPIDIQQSLIEVSNKNFYPLELKQVNLNEKNKKIIKKLADELKTKKRPMLWLGGGARKSEKAVKRFIDLGFGVVTSVQGRGIISEDNSQNLGSYNFQKPIEDFYQTCDCLLVVGSRLRSNETLNYKLKFPSPMFRIDTNPLANGRGFKSEFFINGDSYEVLNFLADELELEKEKLNIDKNFLKDLKEAHKKARNELLNNLGEYKKLILAIQNQIGKNFNWVRDVTLSNSIWGNRELKIFDSKSGVHALGGGIGQSLAMGIGASISSEIYNKTRKTIVLSGDGGFILNLGELATAVQENCQIIFILMNDKKYGVIQNIQDKFYGGRRCFVNLTTPDYEQLSKSFNINYFAIQDFKNIDNVFKNALNQEGPSLIEVDMLSIGEYKNNFAGPPTKN